MNTLPRPALRGGTPFPFHAAAWGFSPALVGMIPPGINADYIAHNDLLAWSLLGVLGVTLGMVTACGLGIYRQFRRVTPETELLEEIKRQARCPGPLENTLLLPPAPPAKPARTESWERPADWWKNPPGD